MYNGLFFVGEFQMKKRLLDKIRDRSLTVGVLGLGYVGLPLIEGFGEKKVKTIGYDINKEKVAMLKKGRSYITDISDAELKAVLPYFKPTTTVKDLNAADAILICVPTPLRKTKEPDIRFIMAALDIIKQLDYKGKLIVLESTTYPGTTEEILLPALEMSGKYKVGKDFFLSFSPERVDPGNKRYNIKNTTKVVGGVTKQCTQVSKELYEIAIESVHPVSSTRVAETVKLLENIYRSVNIGLINEMAQLCHRMDIDIWKVIEAASTKPYGFMPFYPGPGLGGHCIPLDPFYLSWKAKAYDFNTRFIELAGEVNGSMPYFVVDLLGEVLNKYKKSINGSTILIMGVAYKEDIDDTRESPAIDIIRLIEKKGGNVKYHDPYVEKLNVGSKVYSNTPFTKGQLAKADIVLLITAHSNVDYKMLKDSKIPILDTRNGMKKFRSKNIFTF